MKTKFCPKCDVETYRYKNGSCGCCAYISRYMGQLLTGGMEYADARKKSRKAGIARQLGKPFPADAPRTRTDLKKPPAMKNWECKNCGNRTDRYSQGGCRPCTVEKRFRKRYPDASWEEIEAKIARSERRRNGGDWECINCGNKNDRYKDGTCGPCYRRRKQDKYVSTKNCDPVVLENRRQRGREQLERNRIFEDDPRKNFEGKKEQIKAATPPWLDVFQLADIQATYFKARWLSNKSGIKHHVDHIIPLNHPDVCGLHVPWNLQVITWEENQEKGSAKFEDANSF